MKKFFTYFGLNQAEQKGFILLLFCIILTLFIPYVYRYFVPKENIPYNLMIFEEKEKGQYSRSSTFKNSGETDHQNAVKSKNNIEVVYFYFDPNALSTSGWKKLGFTNKQVKVIKNYIDKGGRFYKKEDLKKIYSISESDYGRIEPYIQIEKKAFIPVDKRSDVKPNIEVIKPGSKLVIDINISDTLEWKKLKGIGSVLSKRIIKYREALGGFYTIDQIKEVYGLPVETFETIKDHLKMDLRFQIQKININNCTEEELNRHPYFNKKQSKTIINYRHQHGNFENYLSLFKIKSLDNVFLHKIENYLAY